MIKLQSLHGMGEQIVREVKLVGNGAHIFVPKEWAGEQIVLIREPKVEIKEKIFDVLEPYLDKILGVYLCGSNARGEEEKYSDIDILVISEEKLKIEKEGFDIICMTFDDLDLARKKVPALFFALLAEAKPIINSSLLNSLKKRYELRKEDVRRFISETKMIIKKQENVLESDEKEGKVSDVISYSLILRLRGIFIMRNLLSGKEIYSHRAFRKWLVGRNLSGEEYEKIYKTYRAFKEDRKAEDNVDINSARKIIEILKKEIQNFKI